MPYTTPETSEDTPSYLAQWTNAAGNPRAVEITLEMEFLDDFMSGEDQDDLYQALLDAVEATGLVVLENTRKTMLTTSTITPTP